MNVGDHSPIYDDLMRFKPDGLSPNAWAVQAGVSRTVWADMRRHGNPSRRTLEKLLRAAGSSLAEFEALRISDGAAVHRSGGIISDRRATPWEPVHFPPLPLIATSMADEWGDPPSAVEVTELRTGEIVDTVPRPVSLAADETAYAITIVGTSMWPRFRPGRRVAVSAKAPVAVGDDVLVKLRAPTSSGAALTVRALVKELVRSSGAGVELRQFNPDLTFEVPTHEIGAIEKVLGELL